MEKYKIMNEPVTIVIPAYNEEASIGFVVDKLKTVLTKARISYEVIVVDDGSSDQTSILAQQSGAHVIRHMRNHGYGASLKSGIQAAKYEVIVIIDADGTYPVNQVPNLIEKLQTADMVVGARISNNVNIPFIRKPAKLLLRKLAGYVTGEHIPDLNSGMRAFRRGFVEHYLSILPDKFSFTTTITVAAICDNYTVAYLPIDYNKRVGKSKIVPWDFLNFTTLVLRLSMFFNPLKIFVPISCICFLLGITKLIADIVFAMLRAEHLTFLILTQPILSTTTLILLLSGLQILLIGMVSDGLSRKVALSLSSVDYIPRHKIDNKPKAEHTFHRSSSDEQAQ